MKTQVKISSHELYKTLKDVSKVVSNKTTVPALGYFHFEQQDGTLQITGSDVESTIRTMIETNNDEFMVEGPQQFMIEHKILMDALKELPEQPITINVDTESFSVEIVHANGKFNLMGINPEDFTVIENHDDEEPLKLSAESHVIVNGLKTVLPYVADDELRPVMNSVLCEIKDEKMYFVATNANFLARLIEPNVAFQDLSFLLSPKVAKIISDLADGEDLIQLEVGSRTIKATFGEFEVTSRLVEGNFPNYSAVIPTINSNIATVNAKEFIASLKRATLFANKGSSLITIEVIENKMVLNGKDTDFSISATETISCEYSSVNAEIEIGFKAPFLLQCLQSIDTEDVQLKMSDGIRAALFVPSGDDCQDLTLLLMPMKINV